MHEEVLDVTQRPRVYQPAVDDDGTRRNEATTGALSRRRFLQGTGAAVALGLTGVTVTTAREDGEHQASELATKGRASLPWIDVGRGVRLHVQDWGEGKPIVLVHGWPSSHRIFERQMLALADRGYRAIGIDQRGFGLSDKPWQGNDYDTWARDVVTVVEALGLHDVTLAGYSMGGAIALHAVAATRSPRISRLALISAAAPRLVQGPDNPWGLPPEAFDGMLQAILADRAAFFNAFIPGMFHTPISAEYHAWFTGLVLGASLRATVRGLEEARDRDLRADLATIDIPTTIIHGVHDTVVPFGLAEEQQRSIAGATLVPFEQSGHGIFVDEPDRLTDELARIAG